MQAVTFTSEPGTFDSVEWKQILEGFGHVEVLCVSSTGDTGYALFSSVQGAARAAEHLHETERNGSPINFELCDSADMAMAVKLSSPQMKDIDLQQPSTGGSLFRVTRTEPPIYWKTVKTLK